MMSFFSLGGDHTIVLPILRALYKVYGQPISVIHFGESKLFDRFRSYPLNFVFASRLSP